jgi:hypothetical protein
MFKLKLKCKQCSSYLLFIWNPYLHLKFSLYSDDVKGIFVMWNLSLFSDPVSSEWETRSTLHDSRFHWTSSMNIFILYCSFLVLMCDSLGIFYFQESLVERKFWKSWVLASWKKVIVICTLEYFDLPDSPFGQVDIKQSRLVWIHSSVKYGVYSSSL